MIRELIYICLYTTLEMMNFAGVYLIVFRARLRKNKLWILGSYLLALVIQSLVLCLVDNTWRDIINMVYWVVIPFCYFESRKKKWFLLYPFVIQGTSLINISMTFLIAMVLNVTETEVIYNELWALLSECTCLLLLLFVFGYHIVRKKEQVEVEMTREQYIIFLIGILSSMVIMGVVQMYSGDMELSVQLKNIFGFSVSFMCIVFVIMSLWQGMVMFRELQYKHQTELYETYMQMQEERIREIIDRDEKMRKFRHDMHVHMTVLKAYSEQAASEELRQYLDDIEKNSYVHQTKKYTGNRAVDAVIRQQLEEAEDKGIQVKCETVLPNQSQVSIYDLCTIISNLLKNGVEACEKISNLDARKLEVMIYPYEMELNICIRNTIAEEVCIGKMGLISTKKDKQNHGYGTNNVKTAVKKYGGSIEYTCESGWFQVDIII